MNTSPDQLPKSVLLVGASRGLGHAMAGEFVKKGWHVLGTVRESGRTGLHDLADAHADQVTIETLDITKPDQLSALRERLSGSVFDMLFINAGTANHDATETIGEVSTEEFVRVML